MLRLLVFKHIRNWSYAVCICHRTGRPVTKGSVLASWSAAEPTFALLDARIARRKSILRNAGQLTSVKYKREAGKPVLAARADDQVGRAGRPCRDGGRSSPDTPDTTNHLRQNRATSEGAEFLLHQRVGLNALTSDQPVAFIEQETSTAWCQEDRARE